MQSVFVLADEVTRPKSSKGSKLGQFSKQPQIKKQPQPSSNSQAGQKTTTIVKAETRTCRACLVKGHIYRDCPDNPDRSSAQTVMIARGEDDVDDTADEDIYDSFAFIVLDTTSQESTSIFFTATEVLLDNQAGRSIFKNEKLLLDVCATKPFYIG